MAILKEFRDMADGERGRKAHRPAEVPKYEYEKFRAPSASAAMAPTSSTARLATTTGRPARPRTRRTWCHSLIPHS